MTPTDLASDFFALARPADTQEVEYDTLGKDCPQTDEGVAQNAALLAAGAEPSVQAWNLDMQGEPGLVHLVSGNLYVAGKMTCTVELEYSPETFQSRIHWHVGPGRKARAALEDYVTRLNAAGFLIQGEAVTLESLVVRYVEVAAEREAFLVAVRQHQTVYRPPCFRPGRCMVVETVYTTTVRDTLRRLYGDGTVMLNERVTGMQPLDLPAEVQPFLRPMMTGGTLVYREPDGPWLQIQGTLAYRALGGKCPRIQSLPFGVAALLREKYPKVQILNEMVERAQRKVARSIKGNRELTLR